MDPERQLANLRLSYELWDPVDVPVEDFVELYRFVAKLLFQPESEISGDFSS